MSIIQNLRVICRITFICVSIFPSTVLAQSMVVSGTPCVGSEMNFIMSAGSCTYNWSIANATLNRDYVVLTSSSNSVFKIRWLASVNGAYASCTYSCSTPNRTGSAQSPVYSVIKPVNPEVSITTNDSNQLCQGAGSITFTATPTSGGTPPLYQWYIDENLVAEGEDLKAVTQLSTSLSVGPHRVYTIMTSRVVCAVPQQVTSLPIDFSVIEKTSYTAFIQEPEPVCSTTSKGTYFVTVNGSLSNLTYQWYKNGGQISGATSYLLTNHPIADRDEFYCIVSSSQPCVQSPVRSNTIRVTTIPAVTPTVAIQANKLTFCAGETITFTSSQTAGGYNWQLNGTSFSTAQSISLTASSTSGAGKFTSSDVVTLDVTGLSGTCLTTTSAYASTSNLSFTITDYPTATISPSQTPLTIKAAASQVFTAPTGNGYIYQWKLNGSSIVGATSNTLSANQSGGYSVDVSVNSCKSTSATSVLVINLPPIANAGADQSLSLPLVSINLTGSGNDSDGSIVSYLWTQVEGTNLAISGAASPTVTLSNLVSGTFKFRFQVTDNMGDVGTDDVVVVIVPPPNNYNYIMSQEAQSATQADITSLPVQLKKESITYFDGLGRPMQSVSTQASPINKQDIVTPITYDKLGRENIKYLPYVSGAADGFYKPAGVAEQASFYTSPPTNIVSDPRAFSETIFEPSPLNRPSKQFGPGQAWNDADKAISHDYRVNALNEVYLFRYDFATGLITWAGANGPAGFYDAGQLYANKTTDEQGHEVIEYVDKKGRTICKKVEASGSGSSKVYANTYYIYDDMGNLAVVLPPEGVREFTK